jgi:hypothetical protein
MNKDSSSTSLSAFEAKRRGRAAGRAFISGALCIAAAFSATPSSGDEPPLDQKRACLSVHREAQVSRREGRLVAAREALLQCAREVCPNVIRTDCVDWLSDVDRVMPSIILSARSKKGDEADVHVTMDGRPLATRLTGKSIAVDPGEHTLRFELAPHDPVEEKIIVRQAEKDRVVQVFLGKVEEPKPIAPPPPPPEEVETHRPVPWTVFALGGVAVAGTAMFIGFGTSGVSSRKSLLGSCAPFCDQSAVQSVRTRFIVADVSLGVGVAAAAASVVTFALRPTLTKPKSPSAPSLGVTPTSSGAALSVRGAF